MNIRYIAFMLLTLFAILGSLAKAAPLVEERGNLILDGIPTPQAAVLETLDLWLAGRGASFQDFLGDGSLLISTRFGEVEQLHRLTMPLGTREQLSFSAEPAGTARTNPNTKANNFVFSRDREGNENAQLYLYHLNDQRTELLTDGTSRHDAALWSPNGQQLAFQSNARNGINQDIYVLNVSDELHPPSTPHLIVVSKGENWSPVDWSPDGKRLMVLNYVSVTESYLFVAELTTGVLTPISLPPGASVGVARFSSDSTGVWLSTDNGEEFKQLFYVDLTSGRAQKITSALNWDIDALVVSSDGHYVAYVYNVEGYSQLRVLDIGADKILTPQGVPSGILTNLHFARNTPILGFTLESSQSPRDVWTFDLNQNLATRWTRSETGPFDRRKLVTAELVSYPTWDKNKNQPREIPALIYRPKKPGRHPVLIDIHGGPEGQSRPGYNAFTQYLVNELGYVVIAPNVRGSTGYGRSYTKLDNGLLREDSVRDIGSLLVWIATQNDLDATRVVVTGGSYGGYMSLASLVLFGDRLRGAIDVVGISNFVTFLNNTSAYRREQRRAEYGDERDPKLREYLMQISPLTRAHLIKKPLLIVQGLNDPRVPASESAQMVSKVRGNGGKVWYLAAKDEGHGFRKKINRDFYLKTVVSFLEYLAR